MSNDVRPPIEPMSDLSWARVEKGLWPRLDTPTAPVEAPRARTWIWIAIPSVAIAAAIAAVFAFAFDAPKSKTTAPVVADHDAPTRIVSGAAPSTISIGEAHVTLDADSAVVMPRTRDSASSDSSGVAVLERGGAWFAIAPRTGRQFVVVAGDTTVRVIGTKFRVARYEEHAIVEVERGVVEITYQDTTTTLTAGQTWTSQPPTMPAVTEPAKPAPVVVVDKPAPAVVDKPAPVAVVDKPVKPSTLAIDEEKAKYDRAMALEPTHPREAFELYFELSRSTSAWARPSLYAAARLAEERGEVGRAKTLADIYLRRFPRGANAVDARQLLERLKGAP